MEQELTVEQIIAWNGGEEKGLAEYLIYAINNPEKAKEEILNYNEKQ